MSYYYGEDHTPRQSDAPKMVPKEKPSRNSSKGGEWLHVDLQPNYGGWHWISIDGSVQPGFFCIILGRWFKDDYRAVLQTQPKYWFKADVPKPPDNAEVRENNEFNQWYKKHIKYSEKSKDDCWLAWKAAKGLK